PVLRLYRSIAVVAGPSAVVIFPNRRQSPSTSLPSPPSSLLSTPLIPSSVAVCWRPEFRRSSAGFPCCPIPSPTRFWLPLFQEEPPTQSVFCVRSLAFC
ncbi:hypothetical protein VIGAN_04372100, partial [Vigna angularis var. angularis]